MKLRSTTKLSKVLMLFVTLILTLQGRADSPDIRYDPGQEQVAFVEAIKEISVKFEVFFTFDLKLVEGIKVDESFREFNNVENAVEYVLRKTNLKYRIIQTRYVIIYKDDAEGIESLRQMSHHLDGLISEGEKAIVKGPKRTERTVSRLVPRQLSRSVAPIAFSVQGTVVDQAGEPLIGVNIQVKGTNKGTATDFNGNFTLEDIDENAVLVVSYIGYQTQEVGVAGNSIITITLLSDSQLLDEVVVVGYGTQKKATITGAVTSIGAETLERNVPSSVSNSLAGLLPGLTALNRSGEPGGNISQIYIRGQSTTGDADPLVIVDGIPDETGAWQRINQNDIQQISVLKDASAAIYGARAGNGVILITTKRGNVGKPLFNYSFNQGIIQPTRLPEMANSWEFADYVNQYRVNQQNLPPLYSDEEIQIMKDGTDQINYPNADWIGTIFKDYSFQSRHTLSVRGGTDKSRYSISGSYTHVNSLVRNGLHEYTGYTLRSNMDVDITDNIQFSLDLNGGFDDRINPVVSGFGTEGSPLISAFYPNGLPRSLPGDIGENPAINLAGAGGYNSGKIFRVSLKPSFNINIPRIQGLGIEGYVAFRNEFNENRRWRDTWIVYNYDKDTDEYIKKVGGSVSKPDLREEFVKPKNYLAHVRLKYDNTFYNNHYLSGFIAIEQAEGENRSLTAYRKDFLSPAIQELFAGSGENMSANGTRNEWARQNIFGRINYDFEGKYLFETNLRYDGSFAFPKDKRWGFFPGVSVGWRISEEGFLKNIEAIDNLKLRMSYGQMGNDQISPFQYLSKYNLSPIGTHFGGGTQAILNTGVAPNNQVTWEVVESSNLGVDVSLWSDQFEMIFDIFKQHRTNILTPRSTEVPSYTGLVLPDENVGIIDNKGVELSLTHRSRLSSQKDFSYTVSGNISYAKNKIVDVSEPQDIPEYQKAEGKMIGAQLLYDAIGIFRTEEDVNSNAIFPNTQVGDIQYRDINKDGVINSLDRVRQDKGTIPELSFGLNTMLAYKSISLFANFSGQAKAWTYIYKHARTTQNSIRDLILNRYTPGSMDSKYPILPQEDGVGEGEVSGLPSTFWLQNASFLRFKTLQIQYAFPKKLISRVGLNDLNVFVNGNNLFLITGLDWYDPEGQPTNRSDAGIQFSTGEFYPQTKVYNIGINIRF